ncbi:MAG: hypothetical protein ACOX5I_05760 [Gleimia sp.]
MTSLSPRNGDSTPSTPVAGVPAVAKKSWYKHPGILTAIAVAVIALLVASGLAWQSHAATQQARADYEQAFTTYSETVDSLEEAKTEGQELLAITKERAPKTDTESLEATLEEAKALNPIARTDVDKHKASQVQLATQTVKTGQEEVETLLRT